MKKAIALIVVLGIILLGGGIGAAYYYNNVANYITTDDATVQGDMVTIGSLAPGKLIEWKVKEGDTVNKGDVMGVVEVAPANSKTAAQTVDIVATATGTVIQSKGVKDQIVAAGMPLAMTADLKNLYVTANVLETDINDIRSGKTVKITVDAYPGTNFDGHVDHLGLATQSTFSLLPASNSGGNYTKVTQRVPVVIKLDSYEGKQLLPGLNAYVKIEK
ncbi:MAG: efflux RND transporter periplasmic adaptor subunit [Tumebacillaceae bacterium]